MRAHGSVDRMSLVRLTAPGSPTCCERVSGTSWRTRPTPGSGPHRRRPRSIRPMTARRRTVEHEPEVSAPRRDLLLRIEERYRRDRCHQSSLRAVDLQPRAWGCVLDGHPGVAEIGVEAGGVSGRCEPAHDSIADPHRPEVL